jgi:thiamine-phosphate pyrophosphorylase
MQNPFGLYMIISEPAGKYTTYVEAAVKAGVAFLQLRMKKALRKDFIQVAQQIRAMTRHTGTRFIVNDDMTIAALVDADGVHLGQEDMPVHVARKIWDQPGKIFGLSTHNEEEAEEASRILPDYIGVGPVYPTSTKEKPDPVLGLKRMGAIIKKTSLTTVAIGGITLDNIREVLSHGAQNFCAVRAIMQSADPYRTIAAFQQIWEEMNSVKPSLP